MVWVDFLRGQCFRIVGGTPCETYFSKAKVKNLRVAALGNENVCWFDVSMDDTFQVRSIQTVGHATSNNGSSSMGRPCAMMCFSVLPSRNSIAMNALPFSSPMS